MVPTQPFPAARRCAWQVCAAALLAGLCLAAQAQAAGKPVRPDPLDPDASVPALRYTSPLSASRRPLDEPPISWREANDTVTRIGGWRVYTRQAQQPDPLPASAAPSQPAVKPADAAPATSPRPAGHAGHKSP